MSLSCGGNNIILPTGCWEITESTENDRGTEISHFYMTAVMVKIQLASYVQSSLALQSSPFQSITFIPVLRFFPLLPFLLLYLPHVVACLTPLVSYYDIPVLYYKLSTNNKLTAHQSQGNMNVGTTFHDYKSNIF